MADTTTNDTPPRKPHQNWSTIGNVPSNTPGLNVVTVVFHGLLSFCFDNRTNVVEVGAFSNAFSPEHQPKLRIKGGGCDGLELTGVHIPPSGVTLEIVGPGALAGAFRYPLGEDFDRLDEATNPRDFRWVLDFEGPDFYNEVITRKYPNYYTPKLRVKNGVFYTLERTDSTFKRVSLVGSDTKRLGKIAFCVAASLPFSSGQAVKLTIPGQPLPCTFDYSDLPTDYKIYFTNNCIRDRDVCPDSDFFHHFHSFDPPSDKGRFMLDLDQPGEPGTHDCAGLGGFDKKSTDEAPCGGMGYGGSPGMPPP